MGAGGAAAQGRRLFDRSYPGLKKTLCLFDYFHGQAVSRSRERNKTPYAVNILSRGSDASHSLSAESQIVNYQGHPFASHACIIRNVNDYGYRLL
jgi:hypothetical protein